MYNILKAFLLPVFLFGSGALNAATVDIDGTIFQIIPDNVPRTKYIDVPISAKIGESTTVSYAYEVSPGFDNLFNDALAAGQRYFTTYFPSYENLYVKDSANTAFSIRLPKGGVGRPSSGRVYLLFDLTFAPTASTINADYEVVNSDPNAPRVFDANLDTELTFNDYIIFGPDNAATQQIVDQYRDNFGLIQTILHNGYIVGDDLVNNTSGQQFRFYGTVLPETTTVTPVPIPGSFAMLGLGLLGLGALRKRKA